MLWQDWARQHSVQLTYETRLAAGGTRQNVPSHAHVDSVDHAAAIVGGDWPANLTRGRDRQAALASSYPDLQDAPRLLRMISRYSDLDFELLRRVARWYLDEPARAEGVTPRQVPIPGVHAKWLQDHLQAVRHLTGVPDLGLLHTHPARMHFTYIDPGHRAAGGRVHDSATVGDSFSPAYLPEVVIISENKDTAIHFPPMNGAISVEGMGRGGKTIASFDWIRQAPVIAYWGDIDRDGYEILNGYRADFARDLDSILMDPATYAEFARFGTSSDKHGKNLAAGNARVVERLRPEELEVYRRLIDPGHVGHRRIEQERIPLDRALSAVRQLL